MEFLHNTMVCQFEFETSNQQCNSFVITSSLRRNVSPNLIAGELEKECPGWKILEDLISGGTSIRH